jgi:hypothetical protein
MDEQQKEWTNRHCKELRNFLEMNKNITDETCQAAIGYAAVVVALAKGNKEVQSALFDVLEEFDRRK